MAMSDDRCLDKWIRERDKESFLELVSRHGGMVYGTALRITNNKEMALDIAVVCFEKLMKMESLPQVPILIFLHREATRLSLEKIKPLSLPTEPVNFPTWNDIKCRVDVLIANLTEKYSQPIILHFLEGHAPANLVSYLRQPREVVEERIEKGVEHLRRGLSLLKVNISTAQLMQLLSSNTYEPSPAVLSEKISALLQTFGVSEGGKPKEEDVKKLVKRSYLVPILSVAGVFLIFVISVYFIFIGGGVKSRRTDVSQNLMVSSVDGGSGEISQQSSNFIEAKSGGEKAVGEEGEKGKSGDKEGVEVVVDIEKKLFEMVYSRYEERKKNLQVLNLSSQDFVPTDAFYYYFIALESLGQVDPVWVNQLWETVFSVGPGGVPENFRLQMGGLIDVFGNWRSGALLEKYNFPESQIPGENPIPLEAFQMLIELFALNVLLNAPQYAEQSFQDLQILHKFSVGTYKNAWGDLIHVPLHALECTGIVVREMSRFKILPQNLYRDGLRMILEMENLIQDRETIRYNEYREIAKWVESEFPNLMVVRNALINFLSSPSEKNYVSQMSDSELQRRWDSFLRLPVMDRSLPISCPLEELRKMVYPVDSLVESHRKHADTSVLISKLIVALEWYGMESGFYPSSLDVLVPNYLPEIRWEVLRELGIQYVVDLNSNIYQIQLPDEAQSLLPWRETYLEQ